MTIYPPDYLWHIQRQAKLLRYPTVSASAVRLQAAEWPVTGVDISYWQGAINWDILASMVDFVIIRAGYGNDYFDPRLNEYRQGAMDHNVPFGVYWYLKPGKDWRKQAFNFWVA